MRGEIFVKFRSTFIGFRISETVKDSLFRLRSWKSVRLFAQTNYKLEMMEWDGVAIGLDWTSRTKSSDRSGVLPLINNTYASAREFISRVHSRLLPKESSMEDHLRHPEGALSSPISNNPKLDEEGTSWGLEEMRDNFEQSAKLECIEVRYHLEDRCSGENFNENKTHA